MVREQPGGVNSPLLLCEPQGIELASHLAATLSQNPSYLVILLLVMVGWLVLRCRSLNNFLACLKLTI